MKKLLVCYAKAKRTQGLHRTPITPTGCPRHTILVFTPYCTVLQWYILILFYSSQNPAKERNVNNSEEQESRDKLASSPIRLISNSKSESMFLYMCLSTKASDVRLLVICKKAFQGPQDFEHRKSTIEPRFTFTRARA